MAASWKAVTIDDLCQTGIASVWTGPFGSQLHVADYAQTGVPVVPTEAIRNRTIDTALVNHVTPDTASRLKRHRLQPGDILFARRGAQATGSSGIVKKEHDGFLCGTGAIVLRVVSGNTIDPEFLSLALSSDESVAWFKQQAVGAVMPNLNDSIVRRFALRLPPLPVQRAIARVLVTVDDKIDLNRRMNETLESMARAIFKSWFVDFDPVRAKAEGRSPEGVNSETAALFPGSFHVISEQRVPNGWNVRSLGTVCEFAYGKALKEDVRHAGTVPVFGSNGQVGWHDEFLVRGPGIVVGRKGNPGTIRWAFSDFFPIDTTFYVVPKEDAGLHYLFYLLDSLNLAALGADSAVPGLNRTMAYMSAALCPPVQVQHQFGSLVDPVRRMQHLLQGENRTLAALRDVLLPKLLSGEIRIRDAEKVVESHL